MAEERKLFPKEKLQEVFTSLGSKLSRPLTVYLLGGGAMCFRNQKPGTKDLDLVFTSKKDHDDFAKALKSSGFTESAKLEKAYEDMKASSIWQNDEQFRFDLFTNVVCNALSLSDAMKKRSSLLADYGRLKVLMVSNEDVILFKGITERDKDDEDIASVANAVPPDWNLILAECKEQSKRSPYFGLLYNKLSKFEEQNNINLPITNQLLDLDGKAILREAFEALLKNGLSRQQAKARLMEKEFTSSEIDDAVDPN